MKEENLPAGWLTLPEAGMLAELARDKLVLELGAYLGRSTVVLARAARHVVSIDHHRGSPEHQPGGVAFQPNLLSRDGKVDTLPVFMANLARFGVRDKVSALVARIEDIGPLLRTGAFDVVFVDGDHSFQSVRRDGELARRVVRSPGALAFHDMNWETVKKAVAVLGLGPPKHLIGTLGIWPA